MPMNFLQLSVKLNRLKEKQTLLQIGQIFAKKKHQTGMEIICDIYNS